MGDCINKPPPDRKTDWPGDPVFTTVTKTLSIPMRVLLFAVGVAIVIPLCLWLIVQGYEWLCGTWVACGGVGT